MRSFVLATVLVGALTLSENAAKADTETGSFNFGAGMMGSAFFPTKDYAWAWGPAIELRFLVAPRTEFVIDGGVAGGFDVFAWSPGQTRALMLHAGVAHYLRPWLALSGGLYAETIGNKPEWERGDYIGFAPGVVMRKKLKAITLRLEATGLIGGSVYQADPNNLELAYGLTSSLFASYNWK